MKSPKYDWDSGGYDYLQSFEMISRNATVAGYIRVMGQKPYRILDAACGLAPVVEFLPGEAISEHIAFDNDSYVAQHIPYRFQAFKFYQSSFDQFFADERFAVESFDFVLYLGMYGGYDVYAERLERLLPYTKRNHHLILEAIEEHIEPVLEIMEQYHPDFIPIASCKIGIGDEGKTGLTRERFRSIHLYKRAPDFNTSYGCS